MRSSTLHTLTRQGWEQLTQRSIQTIIDLRSSWESDTKSYLAPAGIDVLRLSLEDGLADDPEFQRWQGAGWLSTPLYYRPYPTASATASRRSFGPWQTPLQASSSTAPAGKTGRA